jgi:ubiquinone/menaquinone biosynthesis C-methylase UbiE
MQQHLWEPEAPWIEMAELGLYPPKEEVLMPAVRALLPSTFKGRRVVDCGCGTGIIGEMAKERGALVTGIDISAAMVSKANERIEAVVGDVSALPFADGSFDIAFSFMTLMLAEDLNAAIKEMHRVLAPAGELYFAFVHPSADVWDRATGAHAPDLSRYLEIEMRDWVFHLRDGKRFEAEYIHRPVQEYFRALSSRFSLNTLIEPSSTRLDQEQYVSLEFLLGSARRL